MFIHKETFMEVFWESARIAKEYPGVPSDARWESAYKITRLKAQIETAKILQELFV